MKERINKTFIEAFKSRNTVKKNILGVIKGEIQNQELRGIESSDENVISKLRKLKQELKN